MKPERRQRISQRIPNAGFIPLFLTSEIRVFAGPAVNVLTKLDKFKNLFEIGLAQNVLNSTNGTKNNIHEIKQQETMLLNKV